MLKNHFLIAWRNFRKTKVSSAINIIGLSTGLTCFIIILLYVQHELSYDGYHKNANRTYRVVKDFVNADGTRIPDATTPPALSKALENDLPEVERVTRFFPAWGRKFLIQHGDKGFYETSLLRVDSNFFKVFDFPFVAGNQITPFAGPLSIIITETAAGKFFGKSDPIGKTLRININNGQDFLVTGILKNVPQNSHFSFDYLIPFTSRNDSATNVNWDLYSFYTYVLLKEEANPASFNAKLQPLFNRYQPESKNSYYAQSLTDIHLRSNLKWELDVNGDISYIYILAVVAVLVIIIAGINYVNLITAHSVKRAKEVGIRKVSGASMPSLVMQFLTESVFTAFVSLAFSLVAVMLLMPLINYLMDRDLALSAGRWMFWVEIMAITLFIGLAAGLYPALHLSAFQPVKVLKGKLLSSPRGAYLRKGLVAFQFIISIALITSFFTIYRQVDFITQKNLGFDKDNIILVPNVRGTGSNMTIPSGSWLDDVKKLPAVKNIAKADGILGGVTSTNSVSNPNSSDRISLNFIRVNHDFLPTFKVGLKEGRNFFDHPKADSASIILNEKAVEQLRLKKPYVGQQLEWDDAAGKTHRVTIVGIAADFHFTSLHEPIKPFAFISEENNASTFFIKLQSRDMAKDIAAIEKAWTKYNPDKPFEYSFQDEQIGKLYTSDIRFKNLFTYVTILASVIACLGLLGLSIFIADVRRKEIGIRKVLGAGTGSLFVLQAKDFLKVILLAIVIASPLAWWAMNSWLENFAYRVSISWWMFVLAGVLSMLIALLTISFQAIRTAVANPVKSLRTE